MGEITRSGYIYLVKSFFAPFILGAIFFYSADTSDLPRGWIFLGAMAVHIWGTALILAKYQPTLLNERQDWIKKKDTKKWDWVLLTAYGIFAFYVQTILMGLDIRYGWTEPLSIEWMIPGFILFIVSGILINWAMVENRFFETTVRIQKDRDQKVVSTGPYELVRHPGYVAAGLWALSAPLIVGSLVGLIPGILSVLVLVIRTHMEDNLLQEELEGYKDYAKKVRYRLLPGVW
jgi:protein-S-isoprenylcysteine O-methyltransferase Ste14